MPALRDRLGQRVAHGVSRDRSSRLGAREQEGAERTDLPPVLAQEVAQPIGQRHVTVAGALAVADVDELALAVDVVGAQRACLADAQPRAVRRHHYCAVLERLDRAEQLVYLRAAQDVGQALRDLRPGQRYDLLGPPQRRTVEEFQSGDVHLERLDSLALERQREQEVPDLTLAHLGGRAHVVRRELLRATQVLRARRGCVILQLEILGHPLAQ
jgi:hypothetical protein